MVVEVAIEGLDELIILVFESAAGQSRQCARVSFSGDEGLEHGSAGDAKSACGHRRNFDVGVFE